MISDFFNHITRAPADAASDNLQQTRRSLPIALLRAREVVMSRFRPMLDQYELSEQQWRVIRMLDEFGEMDAGQLSDRAFVLSSSLTRMIRGLEQRQLIFKRRDADDGRRLILSLGPKGIELIERITPESRAIYRQIEQTLGITDINELLDLLDGVVTKLQA